ncbi:MAG: helix-turn-helix transcriptional regulator [Ferruginibacter sp.]
MNYFRTNLTYLRKTLRINQEQIGNQVYKKRSAISNWEAGLSEPDIDELITLSEYFGVRLDILVLVNMPREKLLTEEDIKAFHERAGQKPGPVEYDTTHIPPQQINEQGNALWQVLDELKMLGNSVDKLAAEIRKNIK